VKQLDEEDEGDKEVLSQSADDAQNNNPNTDKPKDQPAGLIKLPIKQEVNMEVDEDPKYESYIEEINWEKTLERAIQFSMKKSEIITRRSNKQTKKFDTLTLESIKEKILEMEEDYNDATKELGKVWAPHSTIEKLKQIILEAEDEETLSIALLSLEEGFSNPMSFMTIEGVSASTNMDVDGENVAESMSNTSSREQYNKKIIEDGFMFYRNNRKTKKFWSSETLKDSWKEYISTIENGDISALFLGVCIFIDQTEAYIDKLSSKQEVKKQNDEKSSKNHMTKKQAQVDRNERKRKTGFYKEESSDSDEDDDSDKSSKKDKSR
jgi:hypothetical protein